VKELLERETSLITCQTDLSLSISISLSLSHTHTHSPDPNVWLQCNNSIFLTPGSEQSHTHTLREQTDCKEQFLTLSATIHKHTILTTDFNYLTIPTLETLKHFEKMSENKIFLKS